MRPWSDPIVYSHVLFVFNVATWISVGSLAAGIILLASTVASTMYHLHREEHAMWQGIDYIAAVGALGYTLYLTLPLMINTQIAECALILFAGILAKNYAHEGSYRIWHTLWHVLVALGQAYLAWVYWTGAS